MLEKRIRILLVTLLVSLQLVIFSGSAYAQPGNWTGDNWDNQASQGFSFGPPSFSVHPIEGPEDIPVFKAQMKQFIEELREYIRNWVEEVKGDNP